MTLIEYERALKEKRKLRNKRLRNKRRKQKKLQHSNEGQEGSIAKYLKEIDKIKLLSRDEEKDLAQRAAQGDELAKKKLIQANLRFVVNIAKKYQKRGLPLIDLISEGNLGLITAAEKFDHERGYHFISYAVWWIKQSILKALSEKTRLIRLPLNRANQLMQIERLRKETDFEEGEEFTTDEISKKIKISKESVQDILNAAKDYVSLQTPVIQNKRERVLAELLKDTSLPKPENTIVYESLRGSISKVLNTLSEKEREVIKYRYGLDEYKALSLKQIGERFSLTKERIRQIEKKAIKKLQSTSRQEVLRPFLSEE
jgi:RNA polymerase primary sigma factor